MPDPQQQFQYVKLPDGSYGKFLSSASDDQIRVAISKDFPQAFQQQQPPQQSSSVVRFAKGAGGAALNALVNPNSLGQGGLKPQPQDTQPPQSFADYLKQSSLGNIFSNTGNSFLDTLHTAASSPENAGATLMNVLMGKRLMNMKLPLADVAQNAEIVRPLNPRPVPSQTPPPQQVATQPVANESGTWGADPRTGEQILQSVQNMRGGGQGKVAMGVSQGAPSAPSSPRPGFGTAQVPIEQTQQGAELLAQNAAKRPPVQSPISSEPPVTTSGDMTGYYGKNAGKSSLKANQRQLASPTGSTAPGQTPATPEAPHPPNIMDILTKPGMTDADLATVQSYFAKQNLTNMLKKAVGL